MVKQKIIDLDKLISLFFILVIGTLSALLYLLIPKTPYVLLNSFIESLFLVFIFSYEWVILSIIAHYIEKKKKLAIENVKNHPIRYSLILVLTGLIIYGIVIYLRTGELLEVIEKILNLSLLLIGGLVIQLIVTTIYNKIKNKHSYSISTSAP